MVCEVRAIIEGIRVSVRLLKIQMYNILYDINIKRDRNILKKTTTGTE